MMPNNIHYLYNSKTGIELIFCDNSTISYPLHNHVSVLTIGIVLGGSIVLTTNNEVKVNAQKFETAFYAKPDLRNVRPPEEPAKSEPATLDLESLVEQLQKSPELASALAALIAAQAPAK